MTGTLSFRNKKWVVEYHDPLLGIKSLPLHPTDVSSQLLYEKYKMYWETVHFDIIDDCAKLTGK
jgi:hypothetical protein